MAYQRAFSLLLDPHLAPALAALDHDGILAPAMATELYWIKIS
jgi:hypothetical protein